MNTATILALEVAVVANGWCKAVTAPEDVAKRAARAAYSAGSLDLGRSCEAAVVLTDDDRVRLLDRDYRNKDRATNVLSFPAFDADDMARLPVDAPLFLGDIFIALETATAEALRRRRQPRIISAIWWFTGCCIFWAMTTKLMMRLLLWNGWKRMHLLSLAFQTLTCWLMKRQRHE